MSTFDAAKPATEGREWPSQEKHGVREGFDYIAELEKIATLKN
jgi:hypothetical protein